MFKFRVIKAIHIAKKCYIHLKYVQLSLRYVIDLIKIKK